MASKRIVILTGAGISSESGLSTFRDADGIWAHVQLEDVATPQAFIRNPDKVHEFYNQRRRGLLNPAIKPNIAHRALARLQKEWPHKVTLVTQNIDDLHERGGSTEVLHMHGELFRSLCASCGEQRDWREDLSRKLVCANCSRVGFLRPDIVWFEEMPYHMDNIEAALDESWLFVTIGTSGAVYPAAGFVSLAARAGAHCLEINLAASDNSGLFDEVRRGSASELVPAWVDELLKK